MGHSPDLLAKTQSRNGLERPFGTFRHGNLILWSLELVFPKGVKKPGRETGPFQDQLTTGYSPWVQNCGPSSGLPFLGRIFRWTWFTKPEEFLLNQVSKPGHNHLEHRKTWQTKKLSQFEYQARKLSWSWELAGTIGDFQRNFLANSVGPHSVPIHAIKPETSSFVDGSWIPVRAHQYSGGPPNVLFKPSSGSIPLPGHGFPRERIHYPGMRVAQHLYAVDWFAALKFSPEGKTFCDLGHIPFSQHSRQDLPAIGRHQARVWVVIQKLLRNFSPPPLSAVS